MLKLQTVTDGMEKNLIGQVHIPYLSKMRIGPSAYVALKETCAANRKRQAKRELQVVGLHPQQLQVFLEKSRSNQG